MLQDMNTRQLAEAIQEDLGKVNHIIQYLNLNLMDACCKDVSGVHECRTPLATLLSNIDEASDLIIEKTYNNPFSS